MLVLGFLTMLKQTITLDEIVPVSFIYHFHAATGRPRKHQLYPMLWALILQRIFSIPTVTLLITFLNFSQELRDFCGFDIIPDASKFTRFKQDFRDDLLNMFHWMVDLTEPICQKIYPHLAAMTIFDTSGVEAWVTENNPKSSITKIQRKQNESVIAKIPVPMLQADVCFTPIPKRTCVPTLALPEGRKNTIKHTKSV